jgi:hypothetical protein
MAELGAFFGNPNIQRQGARARALAGQRDVNTLADPRTYAIVQGLLGTAPDQMGLSVLNPDYEKIRKAAEPAFALGLLGQAAPLLAPMTKGLPVGASIQNIGKDLSAIQIGDRTIPVTINRIDKKTGGQLVNVNPSAFDEAFSKTGWQYVGEKGKEGISGRYEKFENFLKDAKSIEASNVSVNKDGGIVFGDGRHRYAVLRDMGLDELPIVMDKESIKNAKKFGYLADSPKTPIAPRQEALDKAQRNAALPVEEGLLSVQKEQPMQGLLESKIPSPSSLTMPDVPTIEQMQKYGRVETVPLSKAVSFQSARNWDKFNKGEYSGDLVKGFGDKPLALRLENGEYIIYDGNHRTDLAMQAGKTELPMNVIDVKSYDPAHAGRKPVPPSMSDDELLRSLLE